MKISSKSAGFYAWVAIGLTCLIYAPMAIEYMGQYFTSHAPELYLRAISEVIRLNHDSTVGSLVHHEVPTYVRSRWIMAVHTVCAGIAILLGVLQFSKRVRRNRPVLHRLVGRLTLIVVAASMAMALAFLFRTGSAQTTSGPPFYNVLLLFAIFVLAGAVLAFTAIIRGEVRLHQAFMTYMFAMLLTAPVIRIVVIALLLWADGESFNTDFMIGSAMAGPLAVFGATIAMRYFTGKAKSGSSFASLPAVTWGARVAGVVGLLVVIGVGVKLLDSVDMPIFMVTLETAVLLVACVTLRRRAGAAGEENAAKDWGIMESAISSTPVVCLVLFAIYSLFWPAAMAFFCAILASPVVAMSIGYFPIAWTRRTQWVRDDSLPQVPSPARG
jgi:uncharacterized membrane protein